MSLQQGIKRKIQPLQKQKVKIQQIMSISIDNLNKKGAQKINSNESRSLQDIDKTDILEKATLPQNQQKPIQAEVQQSDIVEIDNPMERPQAIDVTKDQREDFKKSPKTLSQSPNDQILDLIEDPIVQNDQTTKQKRSKKSSRQDQIMSIKLDNLTKINRSLDNAQKSSEERDLIHSSDGRPSAEVRIDQVVEQVPQFQAKVEPKIEPKVEPQAQEIREKRFSFSQPYRKSLMKSDIMKQSDSIDEVQDATSQIKDSQDLSLFQSRKLSVTSEKPRRMSNISNKPFQNKTVASINNIFDNFLNQRSKQPDVVEECNQSEIVDSNQKREQTQAESQFEDLIQSLYETTSKIPPIVTLKKTSKPSPQKIEQVLQTKEFVLEKEDYQQIPKLEQQPTQTIQSVATFQQRSESSSPTKSPSVKSPSKINKSKIQEKVSQIKSDDQWNQVEKPILIQETLRSTVIIDPKKAEKIKQQAKLAEMTFRKQYDIMTIQDYLFKYSSMRSENQFDKLNEIPIDVIKQFYTNPQNQLQVKLKTFTSKEFLALIPQEFATLVRTNYYLFCKSSDQTQKSTDIRDNTYMRNPSILKEDIGNYLKSLGFLLDNSQVHEIQEQIAEYQKQNKKPLIDFEIACFAVYLAQEHIPQPDSLMTTLQFFAEEGTLKVDSQKTSEILSNTSEVCSKAELNSIFQKQFGAKKSVCVDELFRVLTLLSA